MDKKVAGVMRGFIALDSGQRKEFIEALNNYLSGKELLRKSVDEAVRSTTINFGPTPGGCPCCGR